MLFLFTVSPSFHAFSHAIVQSSRHAVVIFLSTALIVGTTAIRWVGPQATRVGTMTADWSPAPTNIGKEDVSFLQLTERDFFFTPTVCGWFVVLFHHCQNNVLILSQGWGQLQ